MFNIPTLLTRNLHDVFGENDPARRRAAIDEVWIEDGVYWFFTTIQEPRSLAAQLWLFSSDSLTGEWTPHRASTTWRPGNGHLPPANLPRVDSPPPLGAQ